MKKKILALAICTAAISGIAMMSSNDNSSNEIEKIDKNSGLQPYCVTINCKGSLSKHNFDAQTNVDAKNRALKRFPDCSVAGVHKGKCK